MEKTVIVTQQTSKTGYPQEGGIQKGAEILFTFLYYLFILFHLLQAYDVFN